MINHIGTQTIETDRLILRKFKADDASDMFNNWANDDVVTEHLSWPTHKSIDISSMIVNDWIKQYESDETYNWAVVVKNDDAVIGSITVVGKSDIHEWAELGYCIGRQYWGKGITVEAVEALIQFLMNEVEYNRVQAIHHEQNKASGRVMQKVGMQYEGKKRSYLKTKNGEFVDVECYAILKRDLNG